MKSMTILAPAHALPSEGDEELDAAIAGVSANSTSGLLDFYARAVGYRGIDFVLDGEEETWFSENPDDVYLQCIDVKSEGGAAPMLDPRMAFCSVHVPDELPVVDEAVEGSDVMIDPLRSALVEASSAFNGTPVPVLQRHAASGDTPATLRCLGLLLADEEDLKALGETVDSPGSELSVILDADEVEGRGLREAVASAAIAALLIGSASEADAGLFFNRDKTTQVSSSTRKVSKQRPVHRPARQVKAKVDKDVLENSAKGNTVIVVDISQQKAFLYVNGEVGVETPVSTARAGKRTPRGEFTITQKVRTGKTSTIYGCDLPCWMRLDSSAYGLHVGELPGYPASAGCVRLPSNIAPIIFDHASSGTVVKIVDSMDSGMYASL